MRQDYFFNIKVSPGPKCSSVQFAQLVEFHLKCVCQGQDCDFLRDWDGESLFWQSDWYDWSEGQEQETTGSLEFFAKRFLRENKIPESRLDDYVKFEITKIPCAKGRPGQGDYHEKRF